MDFQMRLTEFGSLDGSDRKDDCEKSVFCKDRNSGNTFRAMVL